MPRKRHVPPSRIRYEQSHPTISIRVQRELHDRLAELKQMSGKSVADVVREALEVQAPSVRKAYERGRANGFKAAERQYRVDYRCSVCGGTLTIMEKNEKEAAAQCMREHGWAHNSCIDHH